jgi:hypothetical protein
MTNILTVGAPAAIAVSHCLVEQGWTPPPVGRCHRPGRSLLHAGAFLGLLLCRDGDFSLFDWCRAPPPSNVVAVLVTSVELQEHLLA